MKQPVVELCDGAGAFTRVDAEAFGDACQRERTFAEAGGLYFCVNRLQADRLTDVKDEVGFRDDLVADLGKRAGVGDDTGELSFNRSRGLEEVEQADTAFALCDVLGGWCGVGLGGVERG